jgi:peptide alpha-N-acetyltransferase
MQAKWHPQEIPKQDPDYSELLLFYLAVLERNGAHEEALKQLIQHSESRNIVDQLQVMQIQTRLLRKLGRTDEASIQYKKLIERNPDNYESYRAYFENIGISLGW